jgi:hypothetical protein
MKQQLWLMTLLVLGQPVWSQTYPDYIQKQINAGTLTREEARMLYGSPKTKTSPPLATVQPPPKLEPLPTEVKPPEKKAPYRGTVSGLELSELTKAAGGTSSGTVYLLADTPETQALIQRQIDLVSKQRRTDGPGKIARPNNAGGIGSAPEGAFQTPTGGGGAALAQVGAFQTIAGGATVSGPLQDGKFALESPLPKGILMVIVTAGGRTVGVWSQPVTKDTEVKLTPGSAIYWVP